MRMIYTPEPATNGLLYVYYHDLQLRSKSIIIHHL